MYTITPKSRPNFGPSLLGSFLITLLLLFITTAWAITVTNYAGTFHGSPELRDPNGKKLADGDYSQWVEGERLRVKITYRFNDRRLVEETADFRQKPELVQENWSFRESKDGKLGRNFVADFISGLATAEKEDNSEPKRWSEKVAPVRGQAFAGIGFVLALTNLRPRLVAREKIELQAVAFTPNPRVVSVEISHTGVDHIRMGDRQLKGDHFIIHPKIPRIARLFITAPDIHLWFTNSTTPQFLRTEGPLVEPSDPIIRFDLLPGGESGSAKPVGNP